MTTGITRTIQAIVFDYGDVIMRTDPHPQNRHAWEKRLDLRQGELTHRIQGSEMWLRAQRGLITYDDYWRGVLIRFNLDEQQLAHLQVDYFKDEQLDAEMLKYVQDLRRRGYQVGLLSNNTDKLEEQLRQQDIYDMFNNVTISANIGHVKPEQQAYLHILKMLNCTPKMALFIDAILANVLGARTVGMQAIHYREGMDLPLAVERYLQGTISQ